MISFLKATSFGCQNFSNELYMICLQNPADDWLGDLNPLSKVVMPRAYAVPTLHTAAVGDNFQFERLGKFKNA